MKAAEEAATMGAAETAATVDATEEAAAADAEMTEESCATETCSRGSHCRDGR